MLRQWQAAAPSTTITLETQNQTTTPGMPLLSAVHRNINSYLRRGGNRLCPLLLSQYSGNTKSYKYADLQHYWNTSEQKLTPTLPDKADEGTTRRTYPPSVVGSYASYNTGNPTGYVKTQAHAFDDCNRLRLYNTGNPT